MMPHVQRHAISKGIALVLTLCGAVSTSAQGSYTIFPARQLIATMATAQPTGREVTVNVRDSTLKYVINEVARQAHLQPLYVDSPMLAKRISVHATNKDATDVFAAILRGTGLEATTAADGVTIVIRAKAGTLTAGPTTVATGIVVGRVTDSASGVGLGGASVKIQGTKLSVVTSDSGHFTLKDVPPGQQVLSVRLFSYRSVERTVTVVDSGRTTVRIVMVPVPTVLSGVVTTVTGRQRKVEVGNDITTLNVDSIRQVAPITSVTDLLETRVPGLTVLHTSGNPGDPSRIRLRGASSISGNNDPVVIVDGIRVYANQSDSRNQNLAALQAGGITGLYSYANSTEGYSVPSPLDQIDPSSIETIEVLKGPSASALYGSDAATGVIVITTKHGRAGPTRWSAELGAGMNYEPGSWPINYYRFGQFGFENNNNGNGSTSTSSLCAWNDLTCTTDSIVPFQALNDPRYTVLSHGSDQTVSLTVSGGVPTMQYSLTGSAAGDVGLLKLPESEQRRYETFYGPIPNWMVRPDNYQTWGVSGQLMVQPAVATRVTLQSSLFNSNQQTSSLQGAILQLEGEYLYPDSLLSTPLLQNEFQRATSASLTSTNAVTVSWQPVSWLPLSATGGLNTMQRTDQTLIPYGVNNQNFGNLLYQNAGDTTGDYGIGRGTSQTKTLTAGTVIPLYLITLAVGGQLTSQSTADVSAHTTQLAPGVIVPTTFPTASSSFGQTTTAASTYGWYVEPRLNVASKFFVSPGFRLDGGSASGANAGLTAFPKIDLSYVAVDQSRPRGLLTLLRPRLAFGLAGTQPDPTQKLRLLNVGGGQVAPLNDSAVVPVVNVNTLGNTQLRPERSREVEGGADAEFWRGRVTLTATQYDKVTYDAILGIPVAPSVGNVYDAGTIYKNIGEVQNTGTELTATVQVFQSRALGWTVGGNFSNDKNVVVRLNPGVSTIDEGNGTRIAAGYPLSGRWAQPIVAFADVNHDGIIEPNEIALGDSAVYVGQETPKYQMNLNTGVTLLNGRLSVTATFAYQNGLTQFNDAYATSGVIALIPNAPGTSPATQAAITAAHGQYFYSNANTEYSNIGLIQTVNTFRFNDLSINYAVNPAISAWFRVPRMTIAIQGSNLGLHTNYHGIDPDVNAFSTAVTNNGYASDQTVDFGQIPQPRTWWLKISFSN